MVVCYVDKGQKCSEVVSATAGEKTWRDLIETFYTIEPDAVITNIIKLDEK